MKVVFEPSGTHIHKGYLKIRLDFYPDEWDKSYSKFHVLVPAIPPEEFTGKEEDFDKWLEALPKEWRTNPCLSHFVIVPEDFDATKAQDFISQTLGKDLVASLDEYLLKPNAIHYLSPLMRDKSIYQKQLIEAAKETQVISEINSKLSGLTAQCESGGELLSINPESIDVGSDAINRAGNVALFYFSPATQIDYNNPANATGTIDTVQMYVNYWNVTGTGRVGSFQDNGGASFTCNDGESVGNINGTGLRTFSGLTVAINSGEYIGADGLNSPSTVRLDSDATGGGGIYTLGNAGNCDPGDSGTFIIDAGDILSLYGTGTESGGGVMAPYYYLAGNR